MQLISFSLKNYRSIEKTPKLPIDPELTVLIGPNNEGKSNLLRGFAGALDLLVAASDNAIMSPRRQAFRSLVSSIESLLT